MQYSLAHKGLFAFTITYIAAFGLYYLRNLDYEFMAYLGLLVAILVFVIYTLRHTRFSLPILTGLSIWGLLHMMGGSLVVNNEVLYAYKIFPFFDGGGEFYVLKFDQVVHAALYGVVGVMFYHVIRHIFHVEGRTMLVAFVAVMASLGVSAINEIIEFMAVVFIPDTGVGGYYNTALDIVFNFLGALIAVTAKALAEK